MGDENYKTRFGDMEQLRSLRIQDPERYEKLRGLGEIFAKLCDPVFHFDLALKSAEDRASRIVGFIELLDTDPSACVDGLLDEIDFLVQRNEDLIKSWDEAGESREKVAALWGGFVYRDVSV